VGALFCLAQPELGAANNDVNLVLNPVGNEEVDR
jgi:hypothetical protein